METMAGIPKLIQLPKRFRRAVSQIDRQPSTILNKHRIDRINSMSNLLNLMEQGIRRVTRMRLRLPRNNTYKISWIRVCGKKFKGLTNR